MPLVAMQSAPNGLECMKAQMYGLSGLGRGRKPKCLKKWRGRCYQYEQDPDAIPSPTPARVVPSYIESPAYIPPAAVVPIPGGVPVAAPATVTTMSDDALLSQAISQGLVSRKWATGNRGGFWRYYNASGVEISLANALQIARGVGSGATWGRGVNGLGAMTREQRRAKILQRRAERQATMESSARDIYQRQQCEMRPQAAECGRYLTGLGAASPGQDLSDPRTLFQKPETSSIPSSGGGVGTQVANAISSVAGSAATTYLAIEQMKAQERLNKAALKAQAAAAGRQGQQEGTPWTTYALIGGGVVLAGAVVFAIAKRKKG